MAFQGDLASFSLADVFQNLTQNKQTGTLQINVGVAHKERHLHFQKGNLLYLSYGPNTRALYPEIFRSKGLLDQETFDKALNHSRDTGKPFVEAILGLGLANPDQLAVVCSHAIEESVYDLFTWESGPFEFVEGAADTSLYDEQITLPLKGTPGASLIMEAARRIDEWERLKAQVKSLQNIYIFESNLRAAAEQGEFGMAPHELAIMRVMDGSRDVDDLVEGTRLSHFVVVNALVGFLNTSMARLATVDELKNTILKLSVPGLEPRKIKVYERILLLGGEDLSVRQALAETCISAGNAERAIAHLQVLAQSAEQANDKSEALRLYERILELEPDHINAHRRCGELLATGGDSRRAAMHFAALYTKFEADGRFSEAAEACSKAVNSEPLNLAHRLQWVRCAMLADQRPDAMRELEYVGDQMSKQGRIRAAADIYKRLMVMEKSRPAIKAKLQNVLVSEDEKRARRRARTKMLAAFGVVLVVLAGLAWWELVHNTAVVTEILEQNEVAYKASNLEFDDNLVNLQKILDNHAQSLHHKYKDFKSTQELLLKVNQKAKDQAQDLDTKAQEIATLIPETLWPDHPKKKLSKAAGDWRWRVSQNQAAFEMKVAKYSSDLIRSRLETADQTLKKAMSSMKFSLDDFRGSRKYYEDIKQIHDLTHDEEHGFAVEAFYKAYAERRIKTIDDRLGAIAAYLTKESSWEASQLTNLPPTELAAIYRERSMMVKAYPLEEDIQRRPMPAVFIPENGLTGITLHDKATGAFKGVISGPGLVLEYSMQKPLTIVAQKAGYLPKELSTRPVEIGPEGAKTTIYLFGSHDVKFPLSQEKQRVIKTGVAPVAGAINPGNKNLVIIPDAKGNVVGVEIPTGKEEEAVKKFTVPGVAKGEDNEVILQLQSLGTGSVYALVASANSQPRLVAVNTNKAKIEWATKPLGPFRVMPRIHLYTPAALGSKTVIVMGTDRAFFIFQADGQAWQDKSGGIPPPGRDVNWTTLPVISGNNIYVGTSDGGVYCYDIKAPADPIRYEISSANEQVEELTVRASNTNQLLAVLSSAGARRMVLFDISKQTDEKRGKLLQSTQLTSLPSTPMEQRSDFLFFGLNGGNLGVYQINEVAPTASVVDLGNPVGKLTGPILMDGSFLYVATDNNAPKCYHFDHQELELKDAGTTENKTPIGSPLLDVVNGRVYILTRDTGEMYEMNQSK